MKRPHEMTEDKAEIITHVARELMVVMGISIGAATNLHPIDFPNVLMAMMSMALSAIKSHEGQQRANHVAACTINGLCQTLDLHGFTLHGVDLAAMRSYTQNVSNAAGMPEPKGNA